MPARYVPGGRERPDGGAPPPRWPWVLVSVVAVLVLVAGAVVALVLAAADPAPQAAGARPAATADPLLYGAGKQPVRLGSIPGAARLDPALTWDAAVPSGPDGAAASTALRFVQAVRAFDWPTAYGLCAPELRAAARARAGQLATEPPVVVGAAFYGDELHGQAVAGGSMLGVESYPAEYLVTFRLRLADATPATVTLWVSRGYTVQDWT